MLRSISILGIFLVGASTAQGACVLRSDGADSRYVENGTAYALCLQREIDDATQADALRARIDASLDNIRIEIERQRQQQLAIQSRF